MTDIERALKEIVKYQPTVQTYMNYYNGVHQLTFASDKYQTTFGKMLKSMRDNLCPIVVEAPADRMEIINFSAEKKKKISNQAWDIWKRNQGEILSNNVHREAVKVGMSFLIVWTDENGRAKFYEQDSRNCALIEDSETGKPLYGAKMWLTDELFMRLTLYYPDKILKFISTEKFRADEKQIDVTTKLKEGNFVGYESESEKPEEINPYGIIPLFKFDTYPVLSDCIPIQDALNKTICDKLVAMEFAAFRQRYATGLEPPVNEATGKKELPFQAGADRLWFTNDPNVKFGEFGAADLEQFLKVADSYRLEMARVSGTPLHFFSMNVSDAISGEALKTLESRFTKRVKRMNLNFGSVWGRIMQFALLIESITSGEVTTQWDSPEQKSDAEVLDNLLLKQQLGVPQEVLLEEYGYTKEDIEKFNLEPANSEGTEQGA